eukprot:gene15546-6810_t
MCRGCGVCAQVCCVLMPGILGISLTFLIGCFAPGADIKIAMMSYLIVCNILTLFAFCGDKESAIEGAWRAAEKALYLMVFLGGPIGGWIGMIICCHKTSKGPFIIVMVVLTIFNLIWVFVWLFVTAEDSLGNCYAYQNKLKNAYNSSSVL